MMVPFKPDFKAQAERMQKNAPERKKNICEEHSLERETFNLEGHWHTECPECFQRIRIGQAVKDSNIPKRFVEKTIKSFVASNDKQKAALTHVQWFVENWKDSTGMLMLGNPGTGKNHLTAGISKEIIKQGGSVVFTEAIKIFRACKQAWKSKDTTESEVMAEFVSPDLLVIDEIGVQFGSDTEKMLLTEIINDRYNAMKPSILSGNLTLVELKNVVGDRVVDRFRENGRAIIFGWESYRK